MVLIKTQEDQSSGIVMIDQDQRILEFKEKVSGKLGSYSSAGIYVMNNEVFSHMPSKESFSLEYNLFLVFL